MSADFTQNVTSAAERDLVDSMEVEADISRQLSRHAELLPIATFGETARFVARRLRQFRGLTAMMLLSTITASIALAALPWLIGVSVDVVKDNRGMEALWWLAGAMVLTGTIQAIFAAISRAQISGLGQRVLAGMREDVIDRALDLPAQTMERAGIGDALSRVADDVDVTARAVNNIVPYLITIIFQIVVTMTALVFISPWLLIIVVAIAPMYAWGMRWYLPRTNRIYRVERIAKGARAQGLLAAINGIPTVHAYGIEERETRHVGSLSAAAYTLVMRIIGLVVKLVLLMQIPEAIALLLVVLIGFFTVQAGVLPIGIVAAASMYIVALFWPLQSLIFSLDDVQSAAASLTRMVGVITSINPATSHGTDRPDGGALSIQGVSHSYGEGARVVLHPIDLEVAEGETIALVGASGAGKSTLASIMAGTLTPRHGRVLHGGADLTTAHIESVRKHASIVSQDVHVFHGTLRQDLQLTRPGASDPELWEALDAVGAEEWARLLPKGLDTEVGEKGARLTAEQGQQIALARILLQDPAILIMDEATADEGSSGARVLERAALRVAEGRTTVIVAHRLSQARVADRILVMDDGRVVESGSHEELVALGGVYARLWEAWSR
ncbi:MAG: ABC transporter ATP-binding protein [Dermabacter sp.]|nr:ABC transporter ATP-binding protein [Dermabacter sp.]